jgi:hypothetical protein
MPRVPSDGEVEPQAGRKSARATMAARREDVLREFMPAESKGSREPEPNASDTEFLTVSIMQGSWQ